MYSVLSEDYWMDSENNNSVTMQYLKQFSNTEEYPEMLRLKKS